MSNLLKFVAVGAALTATPALAQLNVGLGGGVSGNVGAGVSPGATLGNITGRVDQTVGTVDRTVNRTMNRTLDSELQAATSADLTAGATISDRRGNRVGTIQSVHGDTAVVVKGDRTMHVPISQLYSSTSGLVTKLSKAQLNAAASANASAKADARN